MATPRPNLELVNKAEFGLVQGENPRGLASRLAFEFQMTERTVWRYFRKVRERWRTEELEQREQRRQHFRAMIMANFRLAQDSKNPFCTSLARAGVEAATIQKLAGHKSIDTTMGYIHVNEAQMRSAIADTFDTSWCIRGAEPATQRENPC